MQVTQVLILQPWQTLSSWSSLCAAGHFPAGTGSGPFVPVKRNRNATAYEDFRNNCMLPPLWYQFREDVDRGVMVKCTQTFEIYLIEYHNENGMSSISSKNEAKTFLYILQKCIIKYACSANKAKIKKINKMLFLIFTFVPRLMYYAYLFDLYLLHCIVSVYLKLYLVDLTVLPGCLLNINKLCTF